MVGGLVTDVLVAIRCGRHCSRLVLRDVLLLYSFWWLSGWCSGYRCSGCNSLWSS